MKIFLLSAFLLILVEGLPNYLSDPSYECIKCILNAKPKCHRRRNCASYSVNITYWTEAGELSVHPEDKLCKRSKYRKCMRDENCFVGTIIEYTNKFAQKDCNCDGTIDCKDRFAVHLFGEKCENPNFGAKYACRFNRCAENIGVSELSAKYSSCSPDEIEKTDNSDENVPDANYRL